MHSENEVVYLYLDDIIPNRFQPREVFDERALKELAISIKEHGVIQPIIVRNIGQKYEIIAGERRYKASALAGLTKIPAIVRNLDDKESSKVALLENLQRKNLNPIEEARTYQKILELDQMTQEELAKTMGKSQSAVANKLRLLALPEEVQSALLKEQISERHARTLLNVKDTNEQKDLLKKIIDNRMTVRELEQEIKGDIPQNDNQSFNQMPNNTMSALDDIVKIENPNIEKPMDTFNATPNDFVNNSPLMPNIENLAEEKEELGKITIKPTEGLDMPNTQELPKFINYGEIDDDEDEEDDGNTFIPKSQPIDVNEIKATASDIHNEELKPKADLDSLLNLKAPINTNNSEQKNEFNVENSKFHFFEPLDEEAPTQPKMDKISSEDYFKTPDLIPTTKESTKINNNILDYNTIDNDLPLVSINENDSKINQNIDNSSISTPNIESAIESIKNNLKFLEEQGFKVEFDEMNLERSYQIMIKIQKDQK